MRLIQLISIQHTRKFAGVMPVGSLPLPYEECSRQTLHLHLHPLYISMLFPSEIVIGPNKFSLQLITSVDTKALRLTQIDDELYEKFRKEFSDMDIGVIKEEDLKSLESKKVCFWLHSYY